MCDIPTSLTYGQSISKRVFWNFNIYFKCLFNIWYCPKFKQYMYSNMVWFLSAGKFCWADEGIEVGNSWDSGDRGDLWGSTSRRKGIVGCGMEMWVPGHMGAPFPRGDNVKNYHYPVVIDSFYQQYPFNAEPMIWS